MWGILIAVSSILYLASGRNLTFLEWAGLIGVLITGMGVIMTQLHKLFPIFRFIYEVELKHSEDLVREVFEKPVIVCGIEYDKDQIFLSKPEPDSGQENIHGQIIWQTDYENNKTHLSYVEWNEKNPVFEYAIQHLNHKKYKRIWYAYLNGKEFAELQINKIVNKIQQYREMVERHLDGAINTDIRKGEYYLKQIRHIIFYNIHQKNKTGRVINRLGVFPSMDEISINLAVCEYSPHMKVAGEIVAKGNILFIEHLQNVIDNIENDKEIGGIILEIDSLKMGLKNNSELKIFEDGRKEIINQVKIKKEVLAGACNRCP